MAGWKMMKEFGKAIGKRTGEPNKTSKMIERVAGDSDEFLEGKRRGQFLKGKATDASYQAMYDRLDDDAKAVFDSYNLDFERSYGPDGAYKRALEDAKLDAYTEVPTDRQGWIEKYGFDISEPVPRNVDVSKRVDKLSADESEKALNTEFDKAFEESFNKAKGTFGEAMGKLGGYTPKDKEQAYDHLRQLMIDKLKNGESIEDVLDWGKNKSILIK